MLQAPFFFFVAFAHAWLVAAPALVVLCRPTRGEPWVLFVGDPTIDGVGLASGKDSSSPDAAKAG